MAAKDLTAIGLEILQTARNELYLNLPYLDVALCSLDFQPGGGVTLSLATDGETLYYDGSFLSERYLRSRTAVDRAYLHVLLHCMLRHLWKKRGRVAELWDLACDVAVESILDELDYPCLAGGFVPAKQKFYGECRAEMPVLTAEGIYHHLLRLDLPEYELARLQRTFLVDDHGLWDPDQQDQEQQKQREQKWQGVSEKTQTGLETVLAGKATGGEAVLEQIQVRWTATPSTTSSTPTVSSSTATCPWWSRRRRRRRSGSRTSSSPWTPLCPPPASWCGSFWPAPTPSSAARRPSLGR